MCKITDIAKAARAALKQAFPGSKISVTSTCGLRVAWTDDGPSIEQVKDVLLEAGCAKTHAAWNDEQYLRDPSGSETYCFDRYNVAERSAEQREREQRQQEYEAQRQCENEAVIAALRAKDSTLGTIESPCALPAQDPAVFEAFEKLRLRAEADVTGDAERSRHPTWAPPMLLSEELGEACLTLEYINGDDKLIGRLWATFATPKHSGRYLREHVSSLPLPGISCRGFQFHAGEARGPVHAILFEAQRTAGNKWQFGPHWHLSRYWSPKSREWERLVRERERCREMLRKQTQQEFQHLEPRIAELTRQIDAIDAEDLVQAHRERQRLHGRA